MARADNKVESRRLRNSYFSTVLSISLVLFMMGLLGLIVLHAKKLSDHVKENIGFSIYLKENVKEVDIAKLQKTLDAEVYVKSTSYITSEEAAIELKAELGEDFVSFLGYNPLLSSIDVHLNAAYANRDSITWIKQELAENSKIKEVHYQESLVRLVNENIKKISLIILGFSGLLMLIAIALINSSIRIAIYSKRFLIRSMQLVGATRGFIRRPIVLKGITHGVYGAIIAIALLVSLIYYAQQQLPELVQLQDLKIFGTLFGLVVLLGIIISWISTYFAVNKYLGMKPKHLY